VMAPLAGDFRRFLPCISPAKKIKKNGALDSGCPGSLAKMVSMKVKTTSIIGRPGERPTPVPLTPSGAHGRPRPPFLPAIPAASRSSMDAGSHPSQDTLPASLHPLSRKNSKFPVLFSPAPLAPHPKNTQPALIEAFNKITN